MWLAQSTTDPLAAPQWWAWVFGAGSALLISWQMVEGWRTGVFKKLASFSVLVFAYLGGWLLAEETGKLLSEPFPYPDLILNMLGGALAGCIIFMTGNLLVYFTVPSVEKFKSLRLRRIISTAGLFAGGLIGMAYVLILLAGVSMLGSVAELRLRYEAGAPLVLYPDDTLRTQQTTSSEKPTNLPDWETDPATQANWASTNTLGDTSRYRQAPAMTLFAARLKKSLGQAGLASTMQTVDPVPKDVYRIIEKLRVVSQSNKALQTFQDHPLSAELLKRAEIQELRNDEEIMELARKRDVDALLSHPKIVAVANNRELQALAMEYDIEKALNEALQQAKQDPAP